MLNSLYGIKENIIRPALQSANLWSEESEMLIYGTGVVESGYRTFVQDRGPALGYFQIEPQTHLFLKDYLKQPKNIKIKVDILNACGLSSLPEDEQLIYNLRYSALMARVRYLNAPPCIPFWNDAVGMAEYHAKWYNRGGKADVAQNTIIFKQLIDGVKK